MNDSNLVARHPSGHQPGKQAVHDTGRDVGGDQDELTTSGFTHLDNMTDSLLAGQLSQDAGKSRDGYVELRGEHLPAVG